MQKGNKIILVIGILAIAGGFVIKFEASLFLKEAILTEGKVVYVLASKYKIQYYTNDKIEKIKQGSRKTHGYHEGDIVRIWYRTDNPDRARLTDGKRGEKRFFIIGIVCIVLGIYPLFQKKNDIFAK